MRDLIGRQIQRAAHDQRNGYSARIHDQNVLQA